MTTEEMKAWQRASAASGRTWTELVLVGRRSDGAKFYVVLKFDPPGQPNLGTIRPVDDCDLQNALLTLEMYRGCACEPQTDRRVVCPFHVEMPTRDQIEEELSRFSDEGDVDARPKPS